MTNTLVPQSPIAMTPTTDFDAAMRVSEMLARSSLVPEAYRGKPENVLLATLAGQPFGFDPTMSMRSFNVIQGSPSLKPEVMLALVRRAGHSVTGETSEVSATATGTRADTGDTMTCTFTLEDAKKANLLGKSVWKQYPAAMLWARSLSQLCRQLFGDVTLGCAYTPEELGEPNNEVLTVDLSDTPQSAWVPDTDIPVADAKKKLMQVYLNNGFTASEAKPLCLAAWERYEMPSSVAYIKGSQLKAALEGVEDEMLNRDVEEAEIVSEERVEEMAAAVIGDE